VPAPISRTSSSSSSSSSFSIVVKPDPHETTPRGVTKCSERLSSANPVVKIERKRGVSPTPSAVSPLAQAYAHALGQGNSNGWPVPLIGKQKRSKSNAALLAGAKRRVSQTAVPAKRTRKRKKESHPQEGECGNRGQAGFTIPAAPPTKNQKKKKKKMFQTTLTQVMDIDDDAERIPSDSSSSGEEQGEGGGGWHTTPHAHSRARASVPQYTPPPSAPEREHSAPSIPTPASLPDLIPLFTPSAVHSDRGGGFRARIIKPRRSAQKRQRQQRLSMVPS
jgi:hypothetical protein